jgi:hypothetical protein
VTVGVAQVALELHRLEDSEGDVVKQLSLARETDAEENALEDVDSGV